MRCWESTCRVLGLVSAAAWLTMAAGTASAADAKPLITAREGTLNLRTGDVALEAQPNLLLAGAFTGTHVVLRLAGPLNADREAQLAAAGVRLRGYLPTNCFIADVTGTTPARVAAAGCVAGAYAYLDSWKLDPAIAAGHGEDLLVNFWLFEGQAPEATLAQVAAAAGMVVVETEQVGAGWRIAASGPAANIEALASVADVQYIEPLPEYVLRNNVTTRWTIQSGITNVTPLYARGLTGAGQIIGVIDGGLGTLHCSFADTVNPIGPLHRKLVAYNGTQFYDQHGTHVSGTAAGDAGADTFNTRGVAYGARIAFSTYPSASETSVFTKHMTHYSQGAFIGTNSWGTDSTRSYDGGSRAIDTFLHDNDDALVTHAASNGSIVTNPENAKNSLCVSASVNGSGLDQMCAGIGGSGPTLDGRRKPEVTAPGCSIASSSGASGCTTATLNGTSMATPAVGGLAVLVRQYYVNGFYPTGSAVTGDAFSPSGPLIKATIVNGAQDITTAPGYPSDREGWGRVLGDASLFFGGDTRTMVVREARNASAGALSSGDSYGCAITVASDTLPLRITMSYHDAPAQVNAALTPVNDLDLIVTSPDGTEYRGNVFANGFSVAGGSADSLNNTEQVHIAAPLAGTWSIRIAATAVNAGPQGYALVASGLVGEGTHCPGDFNQDGGVDGLDIEAFFIAWSAGEAAADLNEDGGIDGGDIEAFFLAWECGC
jgi:hypothetical protein